MKEEQIEKIKELLKTRATCEIYDDKYILFHGTSVKFDRIDLTKSNQYTDFGSGFYLTNIYEQAAEWAGKKRSQLLSSFKDSTKTVIYAGKELPKAYVMKYKFDIEDVIASSDIRKKVFEKYDKEWLELVAHYRHPYQGELYNEEKYDITIGPMADGELKCLISEYQKAKKYKKEIKLIEERVLKSIQFQKPNMQITFHTEKALKRLEPFGEITTIL